VKAPLSVIPTLGTLVHAAEAAIDLGRDPQKAIASSIAEVAAATFLLPDSAIFRQLASETSSIVLGVPFADGKGTLKYPEKYATWVARQQKETPWETVLVERRLFADIGPLIIAPKLDLAIRTSDEGELYAVERKTKSTISDDAKWINKFRLNHQISMQIVALAESFPAEDVRGAMIRAVPYSRQNSKKWTSDLPQGLSNTRRKDPLWIRRSPVTEALFLDSLVNVRREFDRRMEHNSWPAEGLFNGMCEFCDYQKFCRGEVPASTLVPLPKDDLQVEEERRQTLQHSAVTKRLHRKKM
jgi:hypothetical protein